MTEDLSDPVVESQTTDDSPPETTGESQDTENGKPETVDANDASDNEKGDGETADEIDYGKLEVPDGVHKDANFDGFVEWAKSKGMSLEVAQEALNMHAATAKASVDAQIAAHQAEVEGWKKAVKDDEELGGKNLEATMTNIAKARAKFGSDELSDFLESTNMADHPAMVRFFNRVGVALAEDQPTPGGQAQMDPLASLYSNSNYGT